MVQASSAPDQLLPGHKFSVDIGGKVQPQFTQVQLPDLSIRSAEHETGADQNYPLKHADKADYGGTFTATVFAKGAQSAVMDWQNSVTNHEGQAHVETVTVNLQDKQGTTAYTWEFTNVTITNVEPQESLNTDGVMKLSLTFSYQKCEQTAPAV
jgi:phage tail-like protein